MRRADSLRDQLEQDIVTGTLRPGERLDEQGLAARFGVSRTPVREAIGRLASLGLILVKPRSGSYVAEVRLEQLTTGDGRPLPAHLKAQIGRELDRLELTLQQLKGAMREFG